MIKKKAFVPLVALFYKRLSNIEELNKDTIKVISKKGEQVKICSLYKMRMVYEQIKQLKEAQGKVYKDLQTEDWMISQIQNKLEVKTEDQLYEISLLLQPRNN